MAKKNAKIAETRNGNAVFDDIRTFAKTMRIIMGWCSRFIKSGHCVVYWGRGGCMCSHGKVLKVCDIDLINNII